MFGIKFFYKKISHLNGPPNGIIKFEKCRISIFGDRKVSCYLTLGIYRNDSRAKNVLLPINVQYPVRK